MEAIFLTDDELKRLETRFGPVVRQMGPWNSDGIFGYASVPIVAVEKAAETLANPNLLTALPRLRTSERTRHSSNCWRTSARSWSRRIVDAYREFSLWPHPSVSMHSEEHLVGFVMPRQSALSGRVLIVDDDERQRSALAAMLSDS
jgi:hypothetical protein